MRELVDRSRQRIAALYQRLGYDGPRDPTFAMAYVERARERRVLSLISCVSI